MGHLAQKASILSLLLILAAGCSSRQAPEPGPPPPQEAPPSEAAPTGERPPPLEPEALIATPLEGPLDQLEGWSDPDLDIGDDCVRCRVALAEAGELGPSSVHLLRSASPADGATRCALAIHTAEGWFVDRARAGDCDNDSPRHTRWVVLDASIRPLGAGEAPRLLLSYSRVQDQGVGWGRGEEFLYDCGLGADGRPRCVHLPTAEVEIEYAVHVVDDVALNEVTPRWRRAITPRPGDVLEVELIEASSAARSGPQRLTLRFE